MAQVIWAATVGNSSQQDGGIPWKLNPEGRILQTPKASAIVPQNSLDIILPCFNPAKGWAQNVPDAVQGIQELLGQQVDINLVLVNDGTKGGLDDSDLKYLETTLKRFQFISYSPNKGKGNALRTGVRSANSEIQIYTDIDFPYTTESLAAIYQKLISGEADVAAGTRNEEYYKHVPAVRGLISKVFRWMLRNFVRIKIADTQCGLKGFNNTGKEVFLQTKIKRFLFDLEFIYLASNEKTLKLVAVPVQLKPGIEFSRARIGILARESLNFMWVFFRGLGRRFRA